jgi:hypothetical protein
MVAIGQDQQVRRGGMDHIEGVEHLAERDQVEIGATQPAGRNARTGQERRLEAGPMGQLGAEPVPNRRHDDKSRIGQQGAQALRGSRHGNLLR